MMRNFPEETYRDKSFGKTVTKTCRIHIVYYDRIRYKYKI